ncbi:MAG: gliding motility lipoprotein GldH [Cytophagales bacterium]|nr:gliding motility lipoprotein GldH [Cytophagales bacterium]
MRTLLLIFSLIILFVACDSTKIFEDFTDLDEAFWHQDSVISFSFVIEDTSRPYQLKAQFRNAQTYPYHNMYYRYTLKDANDSVLSEEQKQIFLFDPKTGEPNGSGLGDLFDNSQIVLENYSFQKSGNYSVDLKQFMRLDTLHSILSVGWRVEAVE